MSTYELRVIDPVSFTFKEFLPDFIDMKVGPTFSDVGAVEFSYPVSGVNYAAIAGEEAEVCLLYNGTEIADGRFLLQDDDGDEVDENGPVRKFVGRTSVYAYLNEAIVYPNSGSTTKADVTNFTNATPGTIIRTLLQRAQTRNAATRVVYASFSNTTDSNGVAWTKTMTIGYDTGVGLLQVLQNLIDNGVIEVRTNGYALEVFNPGTLGTDRTTTLVSPVILRRGRDIGDAPRKRTSRDTTNVVLVRGDEDVLVQRTDATSLAARRRKESYVSQGGVKDTGTLNIVGDTQLALRAAPRTQKTIGLKFATNSPRPWLDYYNGDWIWIDLGNGLEKYRVRQISLSQSGSGERPELALVLNDKIAEREILLARKVQGILGGASLGGGSVKPANTQNSKLAPGTPATPSIGSAAYVATDGTTQAQVTVSWAAVTTNSDGTAIDDLSGYEVQVARNSGEWIPLGRVDSSTTVAYLSALPTGITVYARVRAFDQDGNNSAWSAAGSTTTASDSTAPPIPSTPTIDVTTFMGSLRVKWDGLGSAGESMPADFSRVEVHASLVNGFTPSLVAGSSTLIDELPAGGIATFAASNIGPTYVKLISVDESGNRSSPSAQASATATKADDADILHMGIGKLLVGNLTADMTISARIKTSDIGARVEMNSTGVKAYTQFTTSLAAAIVSTSATSITVNTPTGTLPTLPAEIQVDTERMMVTARAGNVWTVTRGYGGTTAATHTISTLVQDVPGTLTVDINSSGAATFKGDITGSIFKTAASGTRMEMDSTGIKAILSTGVVVFQILASTGAVMMAGTFSSATSGSRIEIGKGLSGVPEYGGGGAKPTDEIRFTDDSAGTIDAALYWTGSAGSKTTYLRGQADTTLDTTGHVRLKSGELLLKVMAYNFANPRTSILMDFQNITLTPGPVTGVTYIESGEFRGVNYASASGRLREWERRRVSVTKSAEVSADVTLTWVGPFSGRPVVCATSELAGGVATYDAVFCFNNSTTGCTLRSMDISGALRSQTVDISVMATL